MPVWKVGDVQNTFVADTHGPGFVLQQEGRSPSLTLIFKDEKTAKRRAKSFKKSSIVRRNSRQSPHGSYSSFR